MRPLILAFAVIASLPSLGSTALGAQAPQIVIGGVAPFQSGPSSDIRLFVQRALDGAVILVGLMGQSVPVNQPFTNPLSGRSVRVWLLQSDGTTAPLGSKTNIGVGNMGFKTDGLQQGFRPVAGVEVSAVVISVDGNLAVIPIPAR